MANKYKFSSAERFAVWQTHDFKCFWCGEPIRIQDVTVDHVIPENLLEKPEDLSRTKEFYELPDDFEINDFCNWVPCHGSCNSRKSTKLFKPSPALIAILDGLVKKAEKAKKTKEKIVGSVKSGKILAKVEVAIENGEITKEDLLELLKETHPTPEFIQIDDSLHCFRLPPEWKVVNVDKHAEMATVVNGNLHGRTPISKEPHQSWLCSCGHYGPWNGARCMSCGMLSDGD